MTTKVYIFGENGLWSRRNLSAGVSDLEYDLDNFLQDRGEVAWDSDEHRGPRWHVSLLLRANADDVDGWVEQLTSFLQEWGVQDRFLFFTIVRERGYGFAIWKHRRVEIARLDERRDLLAR